MYLPPNLLERRRKIRMHRRYLKELLDACPHTIGDNVCQVCDEDFEKQSLSKEQT